MSNRKMKRRVATTPTAVDLISRNQEVENKASFSRSTPAGKQLLDNIYKQQLQRTREDIASLMNALNAAESIHNPSRYALLRIYKKIELESQLSSLIQSRKIKALGKPFEIVSRKGKRNEELTELFKGAWFADTLSHAWDSFMYGYSLIQCGNIEDGKPTGVTLVPRELVKPEFGIVTPNPYTNTGKDYTGNEWAWGCGRPTDLGLLHKLAVLAIYNQHATAAWAQMVELFGVPIRMGKINMSDEKRVAGMYEMLQNMSGSGFGVMDTADEVEFVETMKSGSGSAHEVFVKHLNEQTSKLIFGQTMTADNGSSRSQSEVHERLGEDYIHYDCVQLERMVNDVILPRLIKIGFIELRNCKFQFEKAEDTESLFDMTIEALNQGVPVDLDWFSEKFGIKLTEDKKSQIDGRQTVGADDKQLGSKDSKVAQRRQPKNRK